ncbi:hypothetical protein FH972_018665 [Carpinus fangiana]|uniref:Uncharacterized protein n=1 Tax=Carpinus fangiana TaxID=176857 RepID=A0A5N6RRN6_9ROSI|nr:hypothetical protein FH972_018665 [Carpinus fangiana]
MTTNSTKRLNFCKPKPLQPLEYQKRKIPARIKKGCISWKRIRFHGGSVQNQGEERSFVDFYLKGGEKGGEQVAPVATTAFALAANTLKP